MLTTRDIDEHTALTIIIIIIIIIIIMIIIIIIIRHHIYHASYAAVEITMTMNQ